MPHNEDYVVKVLQEVGLVTRKQVDGARSRLNGANSIVDLLVKDGVLSEADVSRTLAAQAHMEAVIERTAMSPFIREKNDYFAGILDARGRVVCGTMVPLFGNLTPIIFEQYPRDTMRPGDLYWYNDCHGSRGGVSHSPDMVFAAPVFHRKQLMTR